MKTTKEQINNEHDKLVTELPNSIISCYLKSVISVINNEVNSDLKDKDKISSLCSCIEEIENIEHYDVYGNIITIFEEIRSTNIKWNDISYFSTMVKDYYDLIKVSCK